MTASQPYDFAAAKDAQIIAAQRQRSAEQFVIDSWKQYAACERAYRSALAAKIVELKAGGMAVTACADVARGDHAVAALKHQRDISEGVREAANQAAWRASADRKAEQSFLEWSARVSIAETYNPPAHDDPRFTTGRRAA